MSRTVGEAREALLASDGYEAGFQMALDAAKGAIDDTIQRQRSGAMALA